MVLDSLGKSLRESLRKLVRAGYIDKDTLESSVKEIQRAMLSADVNVKLVFQLSENIKKKAWEEKTAAGLSNREHVVHVVYDEVLKALGGKAEACGLKEKGKTRIMLLGLFGSGKTTTCAKLGKYLQKKGLKVAMIGTDIWRPAAFEQLKQLGAENNIPVFGAPKGVPEKILKEALPKTEGFDVIIVDSAGRDALDEKLSKELKEINKTFKPHEKILVMPADLGQKAAEEAKAFNEAVGVTGVILTKLDSTAKGGGALSACAALGVPIKFVGLGEKTEDFEEFNPVKFVSKLLGMGDLEGLVKKTQELFRETPQAEIEELMKGRFTLKELYNQIKNMKKMGPLSKIFEMLPLGIELPQKEMQLSQEKMSRFIYIMDSMTPYELGNPDTIDASRVSRIAKGSGSSVEEVRSLLKHYNLTKKMMKRFGKNKRSMEKLIRSFKGFKM